MGIKFQIEFEEILNEYSQEVFDTLEDTAEEQAKETVKELKATSPKKKGIYGGGWRRKKVDKAQVIYNGKSPYLTHLLEFGHATRNGGRTRAIPHIAPAEQNAIKGFEDKLRKKLEK